MAKPSFEWDSAKDEANQQKHGIAFAEVIRIIGAGYWRKGKKVYETQN